MKVIKIVSPPPPAKNYQVELTELEVRVLLDLVGSCSPGGAEDGPVDTLYQGLRSLNTSRDRFVERGARLKGVIEPDGSITPLKFGDDDA